MDFSATLEAGLCSGMSVSEKVCMTAASGTTNVAALKLMGVSLTAAMCDANKAAYAAVCTSAGGTLKTDFCEAKGQFCKMSFDPMQWQTSDTAGTQLMIKCTVDADCTQAAVAAAPFKECCSTMESSAEAKFKSTCDSTDSVKLAALVTAGMQEAASSCAATNCISAATRASLAPIAVIISAILTLAVAF